MNNPPSRGLPLKQMTLSLHSKSTAVRTTVMKKKSPFRSEGGGGGSDSSAEPPCPCPAACPAPRVPAAPCPCCLGTDGSCVGSPGELPHATGAWLLSSARLCSRPSHGAWCARALSQRLGVFCERSSQLLMKARIEMAPMTTACIPLLGKFHNRTAGSLVLSS